MAKKIFMFFEVIMSRFFALFGVLFCFSTVTVQATPLREGLTIDSFGMEFTLTTMDLGIPVSAVQTKCDGQRSCQYETNGKIAILVTDDEESHFATNVMMFFAGGSDPDELLPVIAGIITTILPNATANERGTIVKETLLLTTTQKLPKAVTTHEGVTFTVTISDVIGLMFIASRD